MNQRALAQISRANAKRFAKSEAVLTVKLSDVKTLSERDRHVLRFYVRGGSKTEARYRDEPEVRAILEPFLREGGVL